MTLKNRLLSSINQDSVAFINLLKRKNFICSKVSETNRNIIFIKRSDNFVCFIDFLCSSINEFSTDYKYRDIIFHLYEKTESGYKAWNSMYGNSSDREACIVKQLIEL